MQKISLFILLGTLPVLAFQNPVPKLACSDRESHHDNLVSHCEMREQSMGAPGGAIRINPGSNGGVSISGWDRTDMLVRTRIETAADSDSEARAIVPQIRIASGGGSIEAAGPQTDSHHQWTVSYEVFAPRQSDIQATAHNGGIKIADLRGNIEFQTENGGVVLARLSGEVHGHTTNGGLTVELAGQPLGWRRNGCHHHQRRRKARSSIQLLCPFRDRDGEWRHENRFPDCSGTVD